MKNKKTTIEVEFDGWEDRQFIIEKKLHRFRTPQSICQKFLKDCIKWEREENYASTLIEIGISLEIAKPELKEYAIPLIQKKFLYKFIISKRIDEFLYKLSKKYNIAKSLCLKYLLVEYLITIQIPDPEFKIDSKKYEVHDEESYVALLKRRGLI
jgi:hypothetical protein